MNKTLLITFLIFLTQTPFILSQCPAGSTLNGDGECQCDTAGKFLRIDLQATLTALNSGVSSLTSLIPDIYDFDEGVSGTKIVEGTNDMYDTGNYLNTNLGNSITYNNKAITSSSKIGSGNSYFTAKYTGIFFFIAQISITDFWVNGETGADGYGSVDGAILSETVAGINYKGLVKRIYGTSDPSVNHLIIVEDNGVVDHEFYASTDNDYHKVKKLQNVKWMAYLLFATRKSLQGLKVSNDKMRDVMVAFLTNMLKKSGCTLDCPNTCSQCISYYACKQCSNTRVYISGNQCLSTIF